jgi:hypothetical protein
MSAMSADESHELRALISRTCRLTAQSSRSPQAVHPDRERGS